MPTRITVIVCLSIMVFYGCDTEVKSSRKYVKDHSEKQEVEDTTRTIGQFPDEINDMLLHIMDCDTSELYSPLDSNSARIFELNQWFDSTEVYLYELHNGCHSGGSCGLEVGVVRRQEGHWEKLLDWCGWIDTVYNIYHNGYRTFSVACRPQHCGDPDSYRWNGKEFETYGYSYDHTFVEPPTEDKAIRMALVDVDVYGDFYRPEFDNPLPERENIILGDGSRYFFILHVGVCEKFLLEQVAYREFKLINVFDDGCEINVQSATHRGMNDLEVSTVGRTVLWQWNGQKYLKLGEKKWRPPGA